LRKQDLEPENVVFLNSKRSICFYRKVTWVA